MVHLRSACFAAEICNLRLTGAKTAAYMSLSRRQVNFSYIFRFHFLVVAPDDGTLELLQVGHQHFLVLETQLFGDGVQVADRIHFALDVNHFSVVEGP
jgi:hypothetical protein